MPRSNSGGRTPLGRTQASSPHERPRTPYLGPNAWGVYDWREEEGHLHVIPEHDWDLHMVFDCACRPVCKQYNGQAYLVHRSFDGREAYEPNNN